MSTIALAHPVHIDISHLPGGASSLLEAEFAEPRVNGLTRSQITARIMSVNPTATPDFLREFSIEDLSSYLEHLNSASSPRGRWSRRIMPFGERAVCWSTRRF